MSLLGEITLKESRNESLTANKSNHITFNAMKSQLVNMRLVVQNERIVLVRNGYLSSKCI